MAWGKKCLWVWYNAQWLLINTINLHMPITSLIRKVSLDGSIYRLFTWPTAKSGSLNSSNAYLQLNSLIVSLGHTHRYTQQHPHHTPTTYKLTLKIPPTNVHTTKTPTHTHRHTKKTYIQMDDRTAKYFFHDLPASLLFLLFWQWMSAACVSMWQGLCCLSWDGCVSIHLEWRVWS